MARRHTLDSIDQYGEWLNPHGHPELTRLIVHHLRGYDDSLAVLRAARPSNNAYEAHVWWKDPTNRAHLLNALLRRGQRSIVEVEREADLRPGKTYAYLKSFGIAFRARPRRYATAMDLDGYLHDAEVRSIDPDRAGTAILKLHGYPTECIGTWSTSNACYRLTEPITEPFGVLPISAAADILRIHQPDLARALWRIGVPANGTVYIAHLARAFPQRWWRTDVHKAIAAHLEADADKLAAKIDRERREHTDA